MANWDLLEERRRQREQERLREAALNDSQREYFTKLQQMNSYDFNKLLHESQKKGSKELKWLAEQNSQPVFYGGPVGPDPNAPSAEYRAGVAQRGTEQLQKLENNKLLQSIYGKDSNLPDYFRAYDAATADGSAQAVIDATKGPTHFDIYNMAKNYGVSKLTDDETNTYKFIAGTYGNNAAQEFLNNLAIGKKTFGDSYNFRDPLGSIEAVEEEPMPELKSIGDVTKALNDRKTVAGKRAVVNAYFDAMPDDVKDLLDQYDEGYLQYSSGGNNAIKEDGHLFSFDSTGVGSQRRNQAQGNQKMQEAGEAIKDKLGINDSELATLLEYRQYKANYDENQRRNEEIDDLLHTGNAAKDAYHAATMTAKTIAMSPMNGMASLLGNASNKTVKKSPFSGIASYLFDSTERHPELGTDTYSPYYGMTNYSQNVRGNTQNRIAENEGAIGKYGSKAYGIGTSIGDSFVNATVGGVLGLPNMGIAGKLMDLAPMGANAYATTLQQGLERGLSEKQAQGTAAVAGLAEMATEIFSLDHFWDMTKGSSRLARNYVVDWLAQAGVEGSEEVASDVINLIADNLINADQSEYWSQVREYSKNMSLDEAKAQATRDKLLEIGESFVGGAISGGVMGGIGVATNVSNTNKAAKATFEKGGLIESAQALSENKDDYKNASAYESAKKAKAQAEQIARKQEAGTEISDRELRQLYWNVNDALDTEAQTRNDTRSIKVKERNTVDDNADIQSVIDYYSGQGNNIDIDQIVPAMARAESAEELVSLRKAAENSADSSARSAALSAFQLNKGRIMSEYNQTAEDFENAEKMPSASEAFNAGMEGGELSETASDEAKQAYIAGQQVALVKTSRSSINEDIAGSSVSLSDGKTVELTGEIRGTGENLQARTKDGLIDIADIQDSAVRYLYGEASKQNGQAAAQTFINNYAKGMPVGRYANTFDRYYAAGATGTTSFEDLVKKDDLAKRWMNEDQLRNIYEYGQRETASQMQSDAVRQHKAIAVIGEGKVIDARANRETEIEYMPLIKAMAKATGMNYVLSDSTADNINGSFNRAMQTVVINTNNAGNELQTLFHEGFGEVLQAHNAEGHQRVQNAIMSYIAENFGQDAITRIGKKYQDAYIGVEGTKGFNEAMGEAINDSIAGIFTSEDGIQDFTNWVQGKYGQKESKTILQSIADFFKDLSDSFKQLLRRSDLSETSRMTANMAAERAGEIRKMILKEMDIAMENAGNSEINESAEASEAYSIKDIPDSIDTIIEENRRGLASMDVVETVTSDMFPKSEISIIDQVSEYFESIGGNVYNDIIGDVALTKRGIKDSVSHKGFNRMRVITFAAVPNVIKNGAIIDYQKNWKNRGYDTITIAAPVDIRDIDNNTIKHSMVATVLMRAAKNNNQRFYLHEVITAEKNESPFKTGRPNGSNPGGDSSLANIIQQAANNYNSTNQTVVKEVSAKLDALEVPSEVKDQTQQAITDIITSETTSNNSGVVEIGRKNKIISEMLDNGNTSLVGKSVKNIDDLAALAQIYRDPRFETMRYFFTDKNGKVILQTAISSKIPGASSIIPEGKNSTEYLDSLATKAKEMGATGYYLEHNHPSGDVSPSGADWAVTKFVNDRWAWRGLEERGHIILDHTQYAVLNSSDIKMNPDNAFTAAHDTRKVPSYAVREITEPGQGDPAGLVGTTIQSGDDLASYSRYIQNDHSVLVFANTRLETGLIQSVPNKILQNRKKLADYIHDVAVNNGMSNAFVISSDEGAYNNTLDLIRDGILTDSLYTPYRWSARSEVEPKKNADQTSFLGRHHVSEEDVRFSVKKPVEETRDLIAVHNLSEEKLMKQFALGGFPMPSIAITKADIGHSNFGDISILFNKNTIDPKNKKNKVYGADAWTPTFPRVEYEANYEVSRKITDRVNNLIENIPESYRSNLRGAFSGLQYNLDNYGGYEGIVNRFKDDYPLQAAYLAEKGTPVKEMKTEKRYEMTDAEVGISQAIINEFGEDFEKLKGADILAQPDRLKKALKEYYTDALGAEKGVEIADMYDRTELRKAVIRAKNYAQRGAIRIEEVIDYEGMMKEISSKVNRSEYETWLRELFNGIEADSGLYNGKDIFTSSGNRRSFKATHYPVNAENIVRAMLAQNDDVRNVSGFVGSKSIRAVATEDFRSIDEIRKASDKLKAIDTEQYDQLLSDIDSRLSGVISEIVAAKGKETEFSSYDNVGELILDAARNKNVTVQAVEKAFAPYLWDVTPAQAKQIVDIINDVKSMPVNMFEAKPQRVVGFDEIAAAVIPDDSSKALRDELSNRGIRTLEYESGNEESRKKVVNSIDDVRFSVKVDSEGNGLSTAQKEYFDGTKAVDNAGRLLTLYHGSRTMAFTEFETSLGAWLTPDQRYAEIYAEDWHNWREDDPELSQYYQRSDLNGLEKEVYSDPNLRVFKLYANIQNPLNVGEIDGYLSDGKVRAIYNAMGIHDAKVFRELTDLADTYMGDYAYQFTRSEEFLDFAKDHGFDGLEATEKGRQTFCAFDEPNQVKLASNINPTQNNDIRYSLDMSADEVFWDTFNEFQSDYDKMTLRDAASIMEQGAKHLKDLKIDETVIKKLAKSILTRYGSKYSQAELADNLQKVFAYMQENEDANYEEIMDVIKEIALPVIEESEQKVGQEDYDNFLAAFKGKKIALTNTQKQEVISAFGSYQNFRVAMKGINIVSTGTPLDMSWSEIVEAAPGLLEYDTTEGDMPLALYDAMKAMTPTVRNIEGANEREATDELAMEIAQEFFNEMGNVTKSDELRRAAGRLKRLNADYLQTIKERYSENLRLAKEELKKQYAEMGKQIEAERDIKIADFRAKNRKEAVSRREALAATHERNMIKQQAGRLLEWATNPTKTHHIPVAMEQPVMDFLQAIDFVSPRIRVRTIGGDGEAEAVEYYTRVYDSEAKEFVNLTGSTQQEVQDRIDQVIGTGKGSKSQRRWTDKMTLLHDLYEKVLKGDQFEHHTMDMLVGKLDESLADQLKDVIQRNNGIARVSQMSSADLKVVRSVIENITHAINTQNRAMTIPGMEISEMAEKTMASVNEKTRRQERTKTGNKLVDFLSMDMATPKTFFSMINSDGAYKILRAGRNKRFQNLKKAQAYMEKLAADFGLDEKTVKSWNDIKEYTVNGKRFQMTDRQLMSLYELNKRQQAMIHMPGGITITMLETPAPGIRGKMGMKIQHNQNEAIHLHDADIKKLVAGLSRQQKEVADRMQQYMASECAAWGNEATRAMYGYEKFTETNYFPIITDKNSISLKNNEINRLTNAIANMGFTKAVTPNARNGIVIADIFDVFTNHVNDMATYNAYAPALTDVLQWYNYRVRNTDPAEDFDYSSSVQAAVQAMTGTKGKDYFKKLIADINQNEQSSNISEIWEGFVSRYKVAAIGANLRVVMQQPTAIARASNMINPKYLAQGMSAVTNIREASEHAKENSEIAWWKSQGYFETNVGKSLKQIITGESTAMEKLQEKSLKLASLADDVTWGIIYRAVELEQADQFRKAGMDIDGDEASAYRKAVNERFDDIIDETQVVDTTLNRSQMMRSKDNYHKMLASFMAEPTKSYNMLMNAYMQAYKSSDMTGGRRIASAVASRAFKRAAAAYTATAVVNAAVQSFIDAVRRARKDDDKDYWERWGDAMVENAADNINPLNLLPWVKDVSSIVQNGIEPILTGESTYRSSNGSRMDLEAISNFVTAVQNTVKYARGEGKKTGYGVFYNDVQALSRLTGIPAANLMRDAAALYDSVRHKYDELPDLFATSTDQVTQSAKNKVWKTIEEGGDYQAALQNAFEKGHNPEKFADAVTKQYKPIYLELLQSNPTEAAQLRNRLEAVYKYLAQLNGKEYKPRVDKWADQ